MRIYPARLSCIRLQSAVPHGGVVVFASPNLRNRAAAVWAAGRLRQAAAGPPLARAARGLHSPSSHEHAPHRRRSALFGEREATGAGGDGAAGFVHPHGTYARHAASGVSPPSPCQPMDR